MTLETLNMKARRKIRMLTGQKFSRLLALSYLGKRKWLCLCDCGKVKQVDSSKLIHGVIKSCGCFRRDYFTTHGATKNYETTPEYSSYQSAKKRCQNKNGKDFNSYGGRGIEFKFNSFEEFVAEVGLKPSPNHSLDRINTDGNYERGNLRWATKSAQTRNRRNTTLLSACGKTQSMADWAEEMSLSYDMLKRRRLLGFCDECAITLRAGESCEHR